MLVTDNRPPRWPGVRPSDTVTWDPSRVPEGWLPTDLDAFSVRWMRAPSEVSSESFFQQWVAHARATLPHPRELETDTTQLEQMVSHCPPVIPAGVICHVTRCGSTLASNALAMVENVRTLSEVPWLDKLMNAVAERPHYWSTQAADRLRHLMKVLAYYRGTTPPALVIKCGIAGVVGLRGIKSLWASIPWVMITRNPVEVVHSNLERPPKAILDWYSGAVSCPFGLPPADATDAGVPGLLAWVVGRICAEATAQLDPTCMVLDYSEISPGAVSAVARHFGLPVVDASDVQISKAFKYHAKRPGELFVDDTCHKQTTASDVVRRAVDKWALTEYQRLLDSGHRLRIAIRTPDNGSECRNVLGLG